MSGFFDTSLSDVLGGYVEIEKAKYETRLEGTADAQKNIAQPTYPANTGAYQNPTAWAGAKGLSKTQLIGGSIGVIVVGLILYKVVK